MGALARLSAPAIDVEPGASASLELSVRNTGTVVDQFSFEVLGVPTAWTTVEPPVVSLFPQAEQTVQVVFSPPRAPGTSAGPTPFGIRVESHEDPQGSVVEEGTVNVAPFSEVVAELTPRAMRVRQRGRVQVLVDNRSNIGFRAELSGADAEEAFDYMFGPPLVDVAPGTVAFTKLTVRAKQRYWRGPSTTQPFQVFLRQQQVPGAEPGAEPAVGPHPPELAADGAIVRDPILPGWLPKALLALLALVLLAALLWFKLVKPQIKAAAQNQVAKDIKPIKKELGQIRQQISATTTVATPPPVTTTTTAPAPTTTTKPTRPTTTSAPKRKPTTTTTRRRSTTTTTRPARKRRPTIVVPVNASLVTTGNNTTATYIVPRGKTLTVTDFLLQNSAGNSGNLVLERNGTVLMSWALADFRDLDYHWITPIYFASRNRFQLIVSGCRGTCTPALYYAGNLTTPG